MKNKILVISIISCLGLILLGEPTLEKTPIMLLLIGMVYFPIHYLAEKEAIDSRRTASKIPFFQDEQAKNGLLTPKKTKERD